MQIGIYRVRLTSCPWTTTTTTMGANKISFPVSFLVLTAMKKLCTTAVTVAYFVSDLIIVAKKRGEYFDNATKMVSYVCHITQDTEQD